MKLILESLLMSSVRVMIRLTVYSSILSGPEMASDASGGGGLQGLTDGHRNVYDQAGQNDTDTGRFYL
jgi:hypothetical protein